MRSLEEIKKISNLKIVAQGNDGFMGYWFDPLTRKEYSVVFSWGGDWEHLSISPLKNDKTPSWELMCKMKDLFWSEDEVCIQFHPRKEDYVNNMPHCLHIWKPIKAKLPTPPPEFVGIKNI